MKQNLFKLRFGEMFTPYFRKLFAIMFFELAFEIIAKIAFFFNLHVFIAHLFKSMNQSIFKCGFTLYSHGLY